MGKDVPLADRNPLPGLLPTRVAQPAAGTEPGGQPPAVRPPVDVSATVAGFDGVVIGRVSRHREAGPSGPAASEDLIVVSVDGDLDADTGPLLRIALTEALQAGPRVCCDLSGVAFFGAAGANALLAAHLHATATGRQLTVRGAHGIAQLVLAITRLDGIFAFTG
jgi:anti-anti-sigma factor